jgi:hypothetical protein
VIAVRRSHEAAPRPHAEALLVHDPHDSLVVHSQTVATELSRHPPIAVARIFGADFPYFLDDFCIPYSLALRFIVER